MSVEMDDLKRLFPGFSQLDGEATKELLPCLSSKCTREDSGIADDASIDSFNSNPNEPTHEQLSHVTDNKSKEPVLFNYTESVLNGDDDREKTETEESRRLKLSHLVGLKHQISIEKRTAIITRLEGINLSTGTSVSFYKCHLCAKLLNRLAELPMHLFLHFEQRMMLYQCLLCDSSFPFKTKLIRHLKVQHKVSLPKRVEPAEAEKLSAATTRVEGNNLTHRPSSVASFIEASALPLFADDALEAPGSEMDYLENRGDSEVLDGSTKNDERTEFLMRKMFYGDNTNDSVNNTCAENLSGPRSRSFMCQTCGFESRKRSSLIHHVVRHHLDLANLKEMEKHLFLMDLRSSSQSVSGSKCMNNGIIKDNHEEEAPFLSSNATVYVTSDSKPMEMECEMYCCPSDLILSPKKCDSISEEDERLDDEITVIIPSEPVLDLSSQVERKSCTMKDLLPSSNSEITSKGPVENEIRSAPIKSMLSPQLFRTKHKMSNCRGSCTPKNNADHTADTPQNQSKSTSTVTSITTMTSQDNDLDQKPLVFNPNDVSPLLRGFLPLPLLSLFLSQSPSSLLGSAFPNAQFSFPSLKLGQQTLVENEKIPLAHSMSLWKSTPSSSQYNNSSLNPSTSEAAKECLIGRGGKTSSVDWRMIVQNRMKGFSSKGSSLSKTQSRKDFNTVSDINRHMDFHEDIRPYKCTHCDYHARTNSQLKVHMMRHQGIRKFQCCLCNYKGVTQSDLNRHAKSQIHMLKARNQCGNCGEGFVSPINLRKHFHERHFGQIEDVALDCRR